MWVFAGLSTRNGRQRRRTAFKPPTLILQPLTTPCVFTDGVGSWEHDFLCLMLTHRCDCMCDGCTVNLLWPLKRDFVYFGSPLRSIFSWYSLRKYKNAMLELFPFPAHHQRIWLCTLVAFFLFFFFLTDLTSSLERWTVRSQGTWQLLCCTSHLLLILDGFPVVYYWSETEHAETARGSVCLRLHSWLSWAARATDSNYRRRGTPLLLLLETHFLSLKASVSKGVFPLCELLSKFMNLGKAVINVNLRALCKVP